MSVFAMPEIKACGTFFSDELPQTTEVRSVECFEIELFTSNGAKFFLDEKEYLSKKGYILIESVITLTVIMTLVSIIYPIVSLSINIKVISSNRRNTSFSRQWPATHTFLTLTSSLMLTK